MTPRRKRMIVVTLILLGVSVAAFLALTALNKNLMYFYTPAQVMAGEAPKGYPFRVGGLVVQGSVQREPNSTVVRFSVTDGTGTVAIVYDKQLPDLFREGQGIIATGKVNAQGVVEASEVLAKHDENYMPPEVADALKQGGKQTIDYKDYRK
jgi:cytochrome c-type biogenesis protein CcmE